MSSARKPSYKNKGMSRDYSPIASRSPRRRNDSKHHKSRRESRSPSQSKSTLSRRNMEDYKDQFKTPMKDRSSNNHYTPRRPIKRPRYQDSSRDRNRISYADLAAENRNLNRIVQDLRKKSDLKQQTIVIKDNLILKNTKLKQQLEDVKAELKEYKEGRKVNASDNDIHAECKVKLDNCKKDYGSTIEKYEEKLDNRKREMKDVKEENERLRKERDVSKSAADSTSERLSKFSSRTLENEKVLNDEIVKLKSTVVDLENKLAERSTALEENEKLKLQMDGLRTKLDAFKQSFKSIRKLDLSSSQTIHDTQNIEDSQNIELYETQSDNLLTSGPDTVVVDDTEEVGSSGDNSSVKVGLPQTEDLFLPSDEEWEDKNFKVGKYIVKNYYNPKATTRSEGLQVPEDIATDLFKPSIVSLNNLLVFVALGSGTVNHKGDTRTCGLYPACKIGWKKGTTISKVRVLDGPSNLIGSDLWACSHHHQASLEKVALQTQVFDKHCNEK